MNALVEDIRLMHIVLRGLPKSWGPFIFVFGCDLSRQPQPTYSNLVERLQGEEYWRHGYQEDPTEQVLLASRFCPSGGRGRGFCQQSYQRPRFNNQTDQRADRGKGRVGSCNYCNKQGHWEVECNLKKLDHQISQLQLRASNLRR